MILFFSSLIVTFGFVGKLPWAPGTWGTLAAFILAWFIYPTVDPNIVLITLGVAILPICGCVQYYQDRKDSKDPKEVVIDEVFASALLLLVIEHSLSGYLLAFVLFRLFDTLKVGPVRWIDQYQGKAQAFGVMADDIVAAIYVAIVAIVMGYIEYNFSASIPG